MGGAIGALLCVVLLVVVVLVRRQRQQQQHALSRARGEITALLEEAQAFYVLEYAKGDATFLPSFTPLAMKQVRMLETLGSGRHGLVCKVRS